MDVTPRVPAAAEGLGRPIVEHRGVLGASHVPLSLPVIVYKHPLAFPLKLVHLLHDCFYVWIFRSLKRETPGFKIKNVSRHIFQLIVL